MPRRTEAVWPKVRVVTGLFLIGLGLVGTLLPVIPGIPLVVAGVALAGSDHPWIRPLRERYHRWRHRKQEAR